MCEGSCAGRTAVARIRASGGSSSCALCLTRRAVENSTKTNAHGLKKNESNRGICPATALYRRSVAWRCRTGPYRPSSATKARVAPPEGEQGSGGQRHPVRVEQAAATSVGSSVFGRGRGRASRSRGEGCAPRLCTHPVTTSCCLGAWSSPLKQNENIGWTWVQRSAGVNTNKQTHKSCPASASCRCDVGGCGCSTWPSRPGGRGRSSTPSQLRSPGGRTVCEPERAALDARRAGAW